MPRQQTIVDPSQVTAAPAKHTNVRTNNVVDPSAVSPRHKSVPSGPPHPSAPNSIVSGLFEGGLGTEPTFKEQKESTWGYYRNLYHHPGQTLAATIKAGAGALQDLSKQWDNVQNGKASIAGMEAALPHFSRGEYGKGVAAYLAKALPFGFGSPFSAAEEGRGRQAIGRGMGAAFQLLTMAKGGPIEAGERTTGSVLREVSGTSRAATEDAAAAHAEEAAEARAKFNEKVGEVSDENTQRLADARQTHEEDVRTTEEANARTAREHSEKVAQVRQQNAAAQDALRAGKDARVVSEHLGQSIADSLPELAESETAKAKAAYPKVSGAIDRPSLYASLKNIEDDTLKGSGATPTSLKRILDDTRPSEGKSSGPTVMGRHFDLSNSSDLAAYNRWKSRGAFTPEELSRIEGSSGTPLTFDDLHGMYSELGKELYKGNLPGDSRAALAKSREAIKGEMDKLAKADGPATLQKFQDAQRGWHKLENVFRNTAPASRGGSPIAAALEARDPITGRLRPAYVRSILADTKANEVARNLLENYPESGAAITESLRLLRRSTQIAKDSPKRITLKSEPVSPEPLPLPDHAKIQRLVKYPEAPSNEPFDPVAWRDQQMAKWASKQRLTAQSLRPWRMPYDIVNRVSAWLLKDPEFRRRVARHGL